jgi:hypothetical protein
VDGHHLSLNFAHAPGETAVTPTFYGANPARVEHGPRAGLRVLGNEEDLGRQLIRGLAEDQRAKAIIAAKAVDAPRPGRPPSLQSANRNDHRDRFDYLGVSQAVSLSGTDGSNPSPSSGESDELERRVITLFTRAHSATVLGFF